MNPRPAVALGALALLASCTDPDEGPTCDEVYAILVTAESSDCVDEPQTLDTESYWYCLSIDGSQVDVHYAVRDGDNAPEATDYRFFASGTLEAGSKLKYDTGVVEDRRESGSVLYSVAGDASLDEGNLVWDGTETITIYASGADGEWPEGCVHTSRVQTEVETGG